MDKEPPLDAFHAREVLHTASIIADLFERQIEQHRFTQATPELREAAARLGMHLYEFYQLVGQQTLDPRSGEVRPSPLSRLQNT